MAKERFQRALAGGNAGDPVQVRKKGEQVEFARIRRLDGWRYVLATAQGRELAWGLISDCHVFTAIMNTSPFIFEAAGRHDWGLQMYAEMTEADPDLTLLMQKEAIDRKRQDDAPPTQRTKPTEESDADHD